MLGDNNARFFPLLVHKTSLMVRYAALPPSNNPTNVYEYGLPHPTTVLGNCSQIPSATKSSPYLFLVGVNCLVNVPLTMLIIDNQLLHLMQQLQLVDPALQPFSCFQLMQCVYV